MVKSVLLDDDIHLLLVHKQTQFLEKRKKVNLSDVAAMAIRAGIGSVTPDIV